MHPSLYSRDWRRLVASVGRKLGVATSPRSCNLSEQLSGSVHTGKSERSAHRRNHIQDPMSLCPARIYALCEQADFPRGERPLPVWGSKKYAAYHDYFDEWEERCATPVRTAARLANNTLVAPSSFPVQKVPSRYAGDGQRPGHTEWYFQPAIRDQAVRSRDGCLVYSFGVQHNDEFTNFWCVCPHQRTRRDTETAPGCRACARTLGGSVYNSELRSPVYAHPRQSHADNALYLAVSR